METINLNIDTLNVGDKLVVQITEDEDTTIHMGIIEDILRKNEDIPEYLIHKYYGYNPPKFAFESHSIDRYVLDKGDHYIIVPSNVNAETFTCYK